ncbi:uncharacterized protein [Lolium perenne]|uniref:uncharacterized protein n=1 Tax=Lolium perenne TaxID=4522 RepID=UPI0021EA0786|nr:uncharacterized protein LOC127291777 [Lolium perenne]XP_051177056.1 uncharacterized protein LOC127291777 [Lolium perenne]
MADLHPPEPETNGGAAAPAAAAPTVALPAADPAAEAAAAAEPPAPPYSKRRRRPSVRLGDIGVQQPTATASDARRPRKPSHSRPPRRAHPDDILDPAAAAAQRRGPPKLGQRRPRTAWVPAPPSGYEDDEGHYYDDAYQSDSAAAARARVSEASVDESDGVADWGLPNGRLPGAATSYGGVRAWLDGLGLARYAPVFEIHEVDDEVLPLLTLEDLKDMGIGAVGSRRKLFDAILKLRTGSDTVS